MKKSLIVFYSLLNDIQIYGKLNLISFNFVT